MAAFRPIGSRGLAHEQLSIGDCELISAAISTNTTVGNATVTAAQLITAFLFRSGSVGAYTDTLDTASNLFNSLAGSGFVGSGAIVAGLGFPCRITNTVAFLETITLGVGMVAGSGSIASIAASSWRDFIFQFTSTQVPVVVVGNNTNASPTVTWTLAPGQLSVPIGPSPLSINITIGATVTGTGIAANTTVIGITQGQGGTLGVTLSANATSSNTNIALSFGPAVTVHSTGSGTL